MAFFSKAGNVLRQISQKHINQEIAASKPSILQMIRCMSSSKVFVGGLSYSTDDTSLREAFSNYGDVAEARVINDRETGRSRGFGFVTYASEEAASAAIQALDGQELHGRRVRVNYANDRPRSFGGGGDGYGGNTYGGQGGGGYGGNTYGGQGGGGYGGNTYGGQGGYGGGNTYGGQGTGGQGTGAYGGNTYEGQGGGNTYGAQGNGGYNAGVDGFAGGDNYASPAADSYTNPAAVPSSSNYGGNNAANVSPGVGLDEQINNGISGGEPAGGEFNDDDDVSGDFANRRG